MLSGQGPRAILFVDAMLNHGRGSRSNFRRLASDLRKCSWRRVPGDGKVPFEAIFDFNRKFDICDDDVEFSKRLFVEG